MTTDFKKLKKLADTCRKAGIKHYKCDEFEFTLTDDAPLSNYKKRSQATVTPTETSKSPSAPNIVEANTLTEEQLLFYSAGEPESDLFKE